MTKGEETKSLILAAAVRLMAQRGIKGVSVRQIQEEAGVNLALAYHYFGSRDGLFKAVMAKAAEGLKEDWERTLSHYENPSMPYPGPETVLSDLFRPVIFLSSLEPDAAIVLGQLLVSPDPKLGLLTASIFQDTFVRFGECLRRSLPDHVSDPHFQISLELMTGSLIILLTRSAPRASMASGGRYVDGGRALLAETVDFCLAGIQAQRPIPRDVPVPA